MSFPIFIINQGDTKMLTLYYTKGTCADVVLMTAKTLAIDVKLITVDISKSTPMTEEGIDFTTINPKGYVPALALDNGEVITEVAAICAYLSELKPHNSLFPLQGRALIDQLQWFNYLATEIHKNYMPLIYRLFGVNVGTEWPQIVEATLKKRYQYIDHLLANQPYLTGDQVTSADFYLFMSTIWAKKVNFDLSEFKNLAAFSALMQQNHVVQTLYPA